MYTRIFFVFFILCLMTIFSDGQRDKKYFREDYKYVEATKSFYKLHIDYACWRRAKLKCELEGATLFYPENDFEAQTVLNIWNETLEFREEVYIGISALFTDGVYKTIDDIPIKDVYHNWGPGEPNRKVFKYYRFICVILRGNGTLGLANCNYGYSFICKKTLASLEWNQPCNMSNKDYTYHELLGRCYKYHLKPMTWHDAKSACIAENSHLAIINSQLEADYLVALAESVPKDDHEIYTKHAVFLGFWELYLAPGIGWKTIKGEFLNESGYNSWAPGRPDKFARPGGKFSYHKNFCGAMLFDGQLYDARCLSRARFLCEHELEGHKLFSTVTKKESPNKLLQIVAYVKLLYLSVTQLLF